MVLIVEYIDIVKKKPCSHIHMHVHLIKAGSVSQSFLFSHNAYKNSFATIRTL